MADQPTHSSEAIDADGPGEGHADAHAGGHDGHAGETRGPVDWNAWGASALGLLAGLGVALLFGLAAAR